MTTPESASSTPDLPIPTPGLIQRIRGPRLFEISRNMTARLQNLGESGRVTPEQERQEWEYLQARLTKKGQDFYGVGGQRVNLADSDRLWVALNILYPKKEAQQAYSVIRSAQIAVMGGTVPEGWNSERVHKELHKHPDTLNSLNKGQTLIGEGAVLRLMDEELGPERLEEQAQSRYTPIRAAAQPGIIQQLNHDVRKIRRFIKFNRRHQVKESLISSPVEQSPVETVKAETGVPVETQAGSTGEENPFLEIYQGEAAKYGIKMPEGKFMPVDRLEVRSFSGIETIPSGYEAGEFARRLPQVGFFGGNDGTITFVGPDGRYWVGPITDENMQALEVSGYKKGSVGNIMNADCTFVDPRLQAEWEDFFSDQSDEPLSLPAHLDSASTTGGGADKRQGSPGERKSADSVEDIVEQQLYEREGRLKLAIYQQNLPETQEAAAEIAGILDSLDDPVEAARYLSALRPDIKAEILSALSKLPSEQSKIIIEIDEKVTRSWIRFYDETATRVPRPITLDKFNELYEEAEAEVSGEESKA